ncbi:MAG: biotin--[acetyl-CoA-carboxylase] ligase [Candidatus Thermoplasmatota archaeon]|nr:biotin--[acetyl-CoA-carboxylase] ligase [Candidatus Thermoplasmatota archaeon]
MTVTTFEVLELLRKNEWISGEIIAGTLKISRTAVWKHIQQLKKKGYHIKAKQNQGYHLKRIPDALTTEEIKHDLHSSIIGRTLHHYTLIESTNDKAKTLANHGEPEGTVVISDAQSQGRGRKQRLWSSGKGGLWFSIILRPDIQLSNAMQVTMCAAVALVEAIQKELMLKPSVKWPNDLLIGNKKICGILTEISAELDEINYLIVGIGLNVNNDLPAQLQENSTTLKYETKQIVSLSSLFIKILESFDGFYQNLKKGDVALIRKVWLSNSSTIGSQVTVNMENEVIEGIAIDIGTKGELIVKTTNGDKYIVSGDITYL